MNSSEKVSSLQEKGFSLIELIISLGIIALATGMIIQFQSLHSQNLKNINTKLLLDKLKYEVVQTIQNDTSWKEIIENPSNVSLNCLQSPTTISSCPNKPDGTSGAGFSFKLIGSNISYDPVSNPSHGFSQTGEFCTDFPSEKCIIQFNLNWTMLCKSSCGTDPLIEFRGAFNIHSGRIINKDQFSFFIFRKLSLDITTPVLPKISFLNSVVKLWEDQAGASPINLELSFDVKNDVSFDICIEKNSKNELIYPPTHARPGIDIPPLDTCNKFTIPAGVKTISIPNYAIDNDTVASTTSFSKVPCVSYVLNIKNIIGATPGLISKIEVIVFDKSFRLLLTSATIDSSNILRINYTTAKPPRTQHNLMIRNQNNEPIYPYPIINFLTSGEWSYNLNTTRMNEVLSPGSKLKVCRDIDYGIMCTNLITITGL